MIDINKHRFYLVQILKEIYSDIELANILGFKGGTALMFFNNLPRFSVDLDFDLLDKSKEARVFQKIRTIATKYGTIDDEAMKFYGSIIVLNYGFNERKLKLEISNRTTENNHYENKTLLGIEIKIMKTEDMFSNKLCALLDRSEMTSRDIFDIHFLMSQHTAINKAIVEGRMGVSLEEYLQRCIDNLSTMSDKKILDGLGELMDNEMKKNVRKKLLPDTITLLEYYKVFPILTT